MKQHKCVGQPQTDLECRIIAVYSCASAQGAAMCEAADPGSSAQLSNNTQPLSPSGSNWLQMSGYCSGDGKAEADTLDMIEISSIVVHEMQ